MNTVLECYPCIVKQISCMLKDLEASEERRTYLMQELLKEVATADPHLPPPGIARIFYRRLVEFLGPDMDPYREQKDRSTEMAHQLLKRLQEEPDLNLNAFENKVRMSIAGNVLDLGIYTDMTIEDAREAVLKALGQQIDMEAVRKLQEKIRTAKRILYLLDNCGEAVFDRLLLEECGEKATIGVRGAAVINDVTRREIAPSGLAAWPVIDSGQRMPGMDPETCSAEMTEALKSSDLIIAKGQGNFESMNDAKLPIAFLFMSKCALVCDMIGAKPRSLQVRFTRQA